jgi:hypothetical protein
MTGSLQMKVYGGSGKTHSTMRNLGSYNHSLSKRLGHTNGTIKKLGLYNGTSTGKSNSSREVYFSLLSTAVISAFNYINT